MLWEGYILPRGLGEHCVCCIRLLNVCIWSADHPERYMAITIVQDDPWHITTVLDDHWRIACRYACDIECMRL